MSIPLGSNFLLSAGIPLDARVVAVNTASRDAIPAIQRFDGLAVYCIDIKKTYQLQGGVTNSDWVEICAIPSLSAYELLANKSTDIVADGASNTKYAAVKAIKDYVDSLVSGLLDYRGGHSAAANTFPTTGGSGSGGAIMKGDMWVISAPGNLGGEIVDIGDSIIANVDTPAQTLSKWNILNSNIGYVPEDVANKVSSVDGDSTENQYPSAALLYALLYLRTDALIYGIGDTQIPLINDARASTGKYARFTDTGLEGRETSDVLADIGAQSNLGYTPENVANKENVTLDTSTTKYPTINLLKTQLDLKAPLRPVTEKTVLTDSDEVTGNDSASLYSQIRTTWYNAKVFLKSYFDSFYTQTWKLIPGDPARVSNTSFNSRTDWSAYIAKGTIIKWTESGAIKCGFVSRPVTYSAPNYVVDFIGDTMASIDAGSLKYSSLPATVEKFVYSGAIGATGTHIANAYYAEMPMRVLGADLQVDSAGTTNSTTIDIHKNGTTMFTTKPTLASTVAASALPFTANNGISLALNDKITIDVDAVQTTPAVDLYVRLYLFPSLFLTTP